MATVFNVLVFAGGIFLVAKALLGPDNGRQVALGSFIANIPIYLFSVINPFFGNYGVVFPQHEALLYGLGLTGLGALMAWRIRKLGHIDLIAIVLLVGAILLSPGPFNLFGVVFWPTPRSMIATPFLHVGVFLVLIHQALTRLAWKREALIALCIAGTCLLGASAYNQVRLTLSAVEQARRDVALADQIVIDLKAEGLNETSTVAVASEWRSSSQMLDNLFMDLGLSAFSTPWSRIDILRLQSGIDFSSAYEVPGDYCVGRTGEYHVGTIEGILAVCIP